MKKVLQPGRALSASQRRQLELQAKMRACTVSPLRDQVEQTLQALAERKEQGVRDEPLNKVIFRDNSSGQPTSTNTVCTGTCGASGTGIGSGSPSGNGTGDEASGDCKSEDCGSGGGGDLHDPENGNFDGQSAEWDKKIADGKDDLKDRLNKLKTAFTPLGDAKLGEGGGKLYCPPPVEFYGRDIDFCLDKFAGSLSWIAAAVYAVCAIAALFIVFL